MNVNGKTVIGSKKSFWLHSADGFDLTHPETPDGPDVQPRVRLQTAAGAIAIDPKKTALVIVDMQNFFLSPSLGRSKDGKGAKACEQLRDYGIPACRKAGIEVLWLNWGLTEKEIDDMPPATLRSFASSSILSKLASMKQEEARHVAQTDSDHAQIPPQNHRSDLYTGLGSEMGEVTLEDGSKADAGRLLMRDQWNTAIYPTLDRLRKDGDPWIHKNRMSGLWGSATDCTEYLDAHGIKTLMFTGVNTDQCVGGSLQDAYTKGYDCILLTDGCGTTSIDAARECMEFNANKVWGFTSTCKDLAKGVENMSISLTP